MTSPVSVRLLDGLPLSTARLTLRPLDPSDAESLGAMLADPEVMRYFPRPMTRAESDAWLRRITARYDEDGTGLFAVCRASQWIGDCGVIVRRIDDERVLELGYHFCRQSWGHGYAIEAGRACVELAFRMASPAEVPAMTALIRPENRPSRRVVSRLGFVVEGAVLHAGFVHERWTLTRTRHAALTAATDGRE